MPVIDIQDVGLVEFPDGMTDADLSAAAKSAHAQFTATKELANAQPLFTAPDLISSSDAGTPTSVRLAKQTAPALDVGQAAADRPVKPTGLGWRAVVDPALGVMQGIEDLPGAAAGLLNTVTGGAAGTISRLIPGDPLRRLSKPPAFNQELEALKSPETQAAQRRLSEAEGVTSTLAEAMRNPSALAQTVARSLPATVVGGGLAGGLAKGGMSRMAAAGLGEGAVSAGQTASQVGSNLTPGQAAISAASGLLTAAFGAIGGKLADRLGIGDVDLLFAPGTPVATKHGILKRALGGMLMEGAVEELPQSMQEQIAQNIAAGKPWSEGVAESGATGLLAGAVMGGGAGVLGGKQQQAETLRQAGAPLTAAVVEQQAIQESQGRESGGIAEGSRKDRGTPFKVEEDMDGEISRVLKENAPVQPGVKEGETREIPREIPSQARPEAAQGEAAPVAAVVPPAEKPTEQVARGPGVAAPEAPQPAGRAGTPEGGVETLPVEKTAPAPPNAPVGASEASSVKLQSGRMVPLPTIKPITSDRTATNRIRKLDEWLHKTAWDDAKASGNDYVATLIGGMKPKALSPADRDMLNDYLFGNEKGINLQSGERLEPSPAKEPSAAPVPEKPAEQISRTEPSTEAPAGTTPEAARAESPAVTAPKEPSANAGVSKTGVAISKPAQPLGVSEGGKESAKQQRKDSQEFDRLVLEYGGFHGWLDAPELTLQGPSPNAKVAGILRNKEVQKARLRAFSELKVLDRLDPKDMADRAAMLPKLKEFIEANQPVESKQNIAFDKAIESGKKPISTSDLAVGEEVTIEGEKMKVTDVDPDTGEVTLEDGTRFGRQVLEDRRTLYVESVQEGKGEVEFLAEEPKVAKLRAGEKQGDILAKVEEPFTLAGEKTTDGERVAAEKRKAEEARKAREDFAKKNQLDMLEATPEAQGLGGAEEKLASIVNDSLERGSKKIGITPASSSRPTDTVTLSSADLKSVSPKVEARWQAATKPESSLIERATKAAESAWHSITREYADMDPRTFAREIDILRRLRASRNANARITVDVLRGITHNIGPKQYSVFNRVVVLEDLLRDVETGMYAEGKELPFGYASEGELRTDATKFRTIADQNPQIKAALDRRTEFMDSLRNTLVDRGFLPESVKEDPRYFHHQVLMYMAEKRMAGAPKSFRDWRSGWQRSRIGSAQDYNRQYVEAEASVISDALNKISMQELQSEMRQTADLTETLKKEFGEEWRSHVPKTHALWQPKKGNVFYPVQTVAEKVMEQYLEGVRELLPENFKEALAVGPKRQEWVVPKELAKVLDNLAPRPEAWIEKLAAAGIGGWKRYILLNPLRAIKYMVNNQSGDLDFLMAAQPKIFTEMRGAVADMNQFHRKGGSATGDIKDAMESGVIGSGWRQSEIPNISSDQMFNWLTGENAGLVDRYWKWIGSINDWREDSGRLAAYRFARKEWDAGRKWYGASVPADVDALPTNQQRAAKVAREVLIDYGRETEFGEYMRRRVMPFFRWTHGNFARYIQLARNITAEEGAATAAQRVGGAAAKRAAVKGAALTARMLIAYMAVNLWNAMHGNGDDSEETARRQLHLVLGKDENGNTMSIRFQGALSDLLSWVGMEDLPSDIGDLMKGEADFKDKSRQAYEAGVSKAVNAMSPFYKTGAEIMMRRSLYPNALQPRPIRDRAEHAAQLFSLSNVYRWVAGIPHQNMRREVIGLLAYTSDPGEAAYYATRHMAGEWLRKQGEDGGESLPNRKSNALYYYKQALRYKDDKLAEKWKAEYFKLGGTEKGMKISVTRSHPLGFVKKDLKEPFLESLSPEQKAVVKRAEEWYQRVYK